MGFNSHFIVDGFTVVVAKKRHHVPVHEKALCCADACHAGLFSVHG
jgi:hypothetical protein